MSCCAGFLNVVDRWYDDSKYKSPISMSCFYQYIFYNTDTLFIDAAMPGKGYSQEKTDATTT